MFAPGETAKLKLMRKVWNFPNFSRQQSLPLVHLWVSHQGRGDWLYLIGIMAHLGITKKKLFSFGLEPPMHWLG